MEGHFEDDVYRELVRSRRHGRPMTIVVVSAPPAIGGPRLRRAREQRALIRRVEGLVRRYDLVRAAAGRVYVLCPELDAESSARLALRLSTQLGLPVGAATFPDDGADTRRLISIAAGRSADHPGRVTAGRSVGLNDAELAPGNAGQ